MSTSPVSIHPYFKAHPGKFDQIKALLPTFVEKTATEEGVLQYEFTLNGDEVFCREAYRDAESALAHLSNVEALLGEMLKLSDLTRLEFHGPASEIEKLREPLAYLKPAWFVRECGVEK
jgi:quinol monooxygenase YgiN